MLAEKKVTKTGSISIPVHIRRELGISSSEKVSIKVNDEGDLLIERIEGSCIFCQGNQDVKKVDKLYVCTACAKKVIERFEKEKLC